MTILMLQIAGVALLALAASHVFFPRQFDWRNDLQRLSLLNRQIFISHCIFLVMMLVMMGLLSLLYARDLVQPSPVNRAVTGGLALFWGLRFLAQHLFYSPQHWRGNRFRTIMHVAFSLLWVYLCATYSLAWLAAGQ